MFEPISKCAERVVGCAVVIIGRVSAALRGLRIGADDAHIDIYCALLFYVDGCIVRLIRPTESG